MIGMDPALKYSQIGLPYLSHHMIFATFHLKPEARSAERILGPGGTLPELAAKLRAMSRGHIDKTVAVAAVDVGLWNEWCGLSGIPIPQAAGQADLKNIDRILSTAPPYFRDARDPGDLYFHLKSDTAKGCDDLFEVIWDALGSLTAHREVTPGNSVRDGHVYGRRILHGLIRSVDAVNLSARAVVGDEDPPHKGSCYCLTQRFVHDWEAISRMSEMQIENMIGRDHDGNLVPDDYERSHLKRSRVLDRRRLNYRILTQGQPFGDSASGHEREEGVYVSAYAKSVEAFSEVLGAMLGKQRGFILDEHFTVSASDQGNIWYVPSSAELGLDKEHPAPAVPINPFFEVRSKNGLMYYNTKDFLHNWGRQKAAENVPLSPRVMQLLGNTFSRWHNTWYKPVKYPSLGHLRDHLPEGELPKLSIPERKGRTIQLMLGQILTWPEVDLATHADKADVFRLDPEEVVVGVIPPFTLGTGVRVMSYLTEEERLESSFLGLDETSMAGHVVPDHRRLVEEGVGSLLREAVRKARAAAVEQDEEKRRFYQAAASALEGVQGYLRNYAALARAEAAALAAGQELERRNLEGIARRMEKLAEDPPASFLDAVQLIFSMHCCLHLIGELVSIGRLDQILLPFYERDEISEAEAQEILDAFWIKMDERVLMNRQDFDDWRTLGTCAVPYEGGSAVPQGDKASQWVMQLTLGGYLAEDGENPRDGSNVITRLCLRSTRRLPFNSPCVSLRVTPTTPAEILEEAARGILSGGAGPTLFNDDLLCRSLAEVGGRLLLRDARDYCADGCWEPIVAGKSEFALTYCPVMPALEATLNEGNSYLLAGPTYLRGAPVSFPSRPVTDIDTFEDFLEIFFRHYRHLAANTLNGLVTHYGNLWQVCPSPLLSAVTDGCMEAGVDLTHGGARYHLLQPMILGVPCAIDSLWAINALVFEPETAECSLPELVQCLMCDWGYDMIEPIQNVIAGPERRDVRAERFKQLRASALGLPKFGAGNEAVDRFGGDVASRLARIWFDMLEEPGNVSPQFRARLDALKQQYELPQRPFAFKLTPGFGTFEDYLGLGLAAAASADGRRKGVTLSSNFSPMPSPEDSAPEARPRGIVEALKGWNHDSFAFAQNVPGPVDVNIAEDFPQELLVDVLRKFGKSELGFNILTISCGDLETMEKAIRYPERYDLLRFRMGGWSEFFVIMFPGHQQQHLRRPLFVPDELTN